MSTIPRLFQEAGRRNLWKIVGVFVGAGWVLLQVIDLFIERGFLPEWVFGGALVALSVGFPLVITTAWVQGGRMGTRVARPDERSDSESHVADVFTWSRAIVVGVVAFALLGLATAGYMVMRVTGVGAPATLAAQGVFEMGGRVVLADFESNAGDAAPGDLITEALRIDLGQSTALRLVGAQEIARALGLMRVEPGSPLTESVAREVAERTGAFAVIAGEVGRLGSSFVLTARVTEPASGDALASFRVTAAGEDDLIDAIDELSSRVRTKIGESLRSVATTEPLPSVSTSSLEALRKYTSATHGVGNGSLSPQVSQQLLREAVAADSTFSMAHRALAVQIMNYGGDREEGARSLEAAFRHRARLSERERLIAEADYYSYSLGDQRRAIQAHEQLLALDSTDSFTAINLSDALMYAGEYEEAVRVLRRTPRWESQPYAWNLAVALAAQRRFDEALAVRDTAEALAPDEPFGKLARSFLLLAAERLDEARAALDAEPPSTYEAATLFELNQRALIDVVGGRFDSAEVRFDELDRRMIREASPSDRIWAQLAWPWSLAWAGGDQPRAREALRVFLSRIDIESLTPFNREYPLLALTYVVLSQPAEAADMLARYRREVTGLPEQGSEARAALAQALLDLPSRGLSGVAAVEEAGLRYRCARCRDFFLGMAYESAGGREQAIDAYERFLAHPFYEGVDFVVLIFNTEVHARLGRLHDEAGHAAEAAAHYRTFASLWANADPYLQPRVRAAAARAQELTAGR